MITGSQVAGVDDALTVFDLDWTATPSDKVMIGGELNVGRSRVAANVARWFGLLAMMNAALTDTYGLTVRYDYFNDRDGTRFDTGVAEARHSITVAPTFGLGDGMGGLVEFRWQRSNNDVFEDGGGLPTNNQVFVAFELIYNF